MKITLFTISLILLLSADSAHSEKKSEKLRGLAAVSYSAGFSIVDSFKKQRVPLPPDKVMRGFEDARKSIRPLMPKGKMRMILHDPKQFLIEDKDKIRLDKESKALYGLSAVSYAAGFRMGDIFKKQRVPLTPEMVSRGLEDAHNSIRPLITPDKMQTILRDPKKYLIDGANQSAGQVKKSADAFLVANAKKEGVKVLESGLQYKIISGGSGERPQFTDSVRIDYQASTIKGHVFDSTEEAGKPVVLMMNGVIPGLSEGLQLMSEGAEWELYIPSNLAYGSEGPLADQALIYAVKLVEILPKK